MTQRVVRNAAALVIGNELLSGKIRDANVSELARALRALGIRLQRVVMLPDDIAILAAEVRALSASYDVVFTSGGVGPTHDDVTDAHLLMARVPRGAELRRSPDVQWPTPVMNNVWILPGIPDLFRLKLLTVRAWLRGPVPFVSRALFLRLEEPLVKPILDVVVTRHPAVEIGSYPKWFDSTYRTQITFDAETAEAAQAALDDLRGL